MFKNKGISYMNKATKKRHVFKVAFKFQIKTTGT